MRAQASAKVRFNGTIAATALTAAVAAAALGSAPMAGASCASFFGIGGGANCSSTLTTVAIALGQNARAHADGIAGAALTLGADAITAVEDGGFSFGVAVGKNTIVVNRGYFSVASAVGPFTTAGTGGAPGFIDTGLFNIALNLSPFNKALYPTVTAGVGNVAVNLFGVNDSFQGNPEVIGGGLASVAANIGGKRNTVWAQGKLLNTAVNALGSDNEVYAYDGLLNSSSQVFGSGNRVQSGAGPLSFAASVFQKAKTVVKTKPGVNINGFKIPDTAAAANPVASRAAAVKSRKVGSAAAEPSATKRVGSNSARG